MWVTCIWVVALAESQMMSPPNLGKTKRQRMSERPSPLKSLRFAPGVVATEVDETARHAIPSSSPFAIDVCVACMACTSPVRADAPLQKTFATSTAVRPRGGLHPLVVWFASADEPATPGAVARMASALFAELKRRKVVKVGAVYLVSAWLAVQAASIGFPAFEAPAWVLRVFILVLLLGFPDRGGAHVGARTHARGHATGSLAGRQQARRRRRHRSRGARTRLVLLRPTERAAGAAGRRIAARVLPHLRLSSTTSRSRCSPSAISARSTTRIISPTACRRRSSTRWRRSAICASRGAPRRSITRAATSTCARSASRSASRTCLKAPCARKATRCASPRS